MLTALKQMFSRHQRQLTVVSALAFSTLLSIFMLIMRIAHTASAIYLFLIWNLFLAWIPMLCALMLYNAHKRHIHQHWLLKLTYALGWLLFMPNAPYIVTDIVNLQASAEIPFWYDILLFMSSAWTGVFLGLVSLFLMQQIVKSSIGKWRSWLFALVVLALNSFGIYLGRFLRWNSWDVLFNPLELLGDIASTLRHPFDHIETYIFSIIFMVFITAAYLMLTSMMSFQQETS